MATNKRTIGSEGLEQGGPNLGNDYERTNTTPAGGAKVIPVHETTMEDFNTDENGKDSEQYEKGHGEKEKKGE